MADYFSNTSSYLKNCENKAKPKLQCNGKCQMMKKITAEEKKDQDNPERKSENKNEVLLSSKSFYATFQLQAILLNSKLLLFPYSNGKAIDRSIDILHPPQV